MLSEARRVNKMPDIDDRTKGDRRGKKRVSPSSSDDERNSRERMPAAKKIRKNKQSSDSTKEQKREETTSVLGFKDKEKALGSIESLKERDISYQYHAITGLVRRAGRVISCTKDAQKIENMKAAVEVFENWLTDYNVNQRSKENFGYLSLDLVQAYQPLAQKHQLEIPEFVSAYEKVGGDYKKLRSVKVRDEETTWDVERNRKLRKFVHNIAERHKQWFETDAPLRGLPTKEHTECIMWGFSHEPAKLKKTLALLNEKL